MMHRTLHVKLCWTSSWFFSCHTIVTFQWAIQTWNILWKVHSISHLCYFNSYRQSNLVSTSAKIEGGWELINTPLFFFLLTTHTVAYQGMFKLLLSPENYRECKVCILICVPRTAVCLLEPYLGGVCTQYSVCVSQPDRIGMLLAP